MRRSEGRLAVLVALAVVGCERGLPGADLGERAAGPADVAAPVVPGCAPFRGVAGVEAVSGAVRSLPQADASVLFLVDEAIVSGAPVASLALVAPPGATLDGCLSTATIAPGGPGAALDPATLSPLSGALAGGATVLYYSDASGSIGVARRDATDGRLRPDGPPLWSSDRPSYGSAVVVEGDGVEVIGCRSARFLDADCFAARAPATGVADESQYEYYTGGGHFSSRVDDAWPMTTGPASLDLARFGARWLLAYVTPLGSTITVRSGLSPHGPWSAPIAVATCALADADMFCAGIHLHPAVASPPGTIVVSYAPATFSPDAGARRQAEPDRWSPRMFALTVPPLP